MRRFVQPARSRRTKRSSQEEIATPQLSTMSLLDHQKTVGNRQTQTLVERLTLQRLTKQQKIEGRGFTTEEAIALKELFGGWVEADRWTEERITPDYYRYVLKFTFEPAVRKRIFIQLNLDTLKELITLAGDAEIAKLVNANINIRSFQALLRHGLGLDKALELADQQLTLSLLHIMLPREHLWNEILTALQNTDVKKLNTAMIWFKDRDTNTRTYLEDTKTPVTAWLKMSEYGWDDSDVKALAHFQREVPPSNDDYEEIGTRKYRIGHFARYHTLWDFPVGLALDEGKTFWPLTYSLTNLRQIAQQIDDNQAQWKVINNAEIFNTQYSISLNGYNIRFMVQETTSGERVHQLYPYNGNDYSASKIAQFQAIRSKLPNWRAWT